VTVISSQVPDKPGLRPNLPSDFRPYTYQNHSTNQKEKHMAKRLFKISVVASSLYVVVCFIAILTEHILNNPDKPDGQAVRR
jgi:lipopolysaccharide/colanic/teichoic acid biosynthesis glycosyltransferase